METVIIRKISHIQNNLEIGTYSNPFTFQGNLENVKFFDKRKMYKDCNATCIYDNKVCEIVTSDTIMTIKHHEHLQKIAKNWSCIPHLLMVDNNCITNIIPYNVKALADFSWISASKTRNFILDDPLIDYLKYNNINPIIEKPQLTHRKRGYSETFDEQLMNNGNNFEISVMDYIKDNVDEKNYIKIGESYEALNYTKYIETLNAIKMNIPVIYQPVLWNPSNKTFGCADIIIKSSIAKKLFPNYISHYKNRDVYEVYDIKWSTISLISGTVYLNNDKKAKTYKSQLWIYTQALNKMTGDNISTAYVLGKKNKRMRIEDDGSKTSAITSNTYNEIALIDYRREKNNIKLFRDALKWLYELKNNKDLHHDPPNDFRLYPNMKNHDNEYHLIKKDLAKRNGEITLLFNVGVKHRKNANENGVFKITDKKLTTELLGLKSSSNTSLIENIIKVNKETCNDIVLYNNMTNDGNWKNAKIRCYLDIETINSTVYNLAHSRPNYIFMIGIGVVINNEWTFTKFTVTSIQGEEELRIIEGIDKFLDDLVKKHKKVKHIPIYHWANFERVNLLPLLTLNDKYQFHDMCKWVKNNGICVKGAYDFKLKNFAKAMYDNNLINAKWPDSISDGIDAMNTAYNYYNHNVGDKSVIKEIERYNEIDCMTMFEIHQYMKTID